MKKSLLLIFLGTTLFSFAQGAGTNGAITLTTGYSIDLEISSVTNKTRLTLVGPADKWLAVGFGGSNMSSGADVFRTDGTTPIDAKTTGQFLPPADSSQDWSLVSNTTNGNVRTMVVERDNNTGDADDIVFSPSATSLPIIWAIGSSSTFVSHSNRGATVLSILSSKEFKNLDFEVYPNPSKDIVNVQLPTGMISASAKVFDTAGRLIATQEISNPREQINISKLSSGVYVLRIASEGRFGARRIIKN